MEDTETAPLELRLSPSEISHSDSKWTIVEMKSLNVQLVLHLSKHLCFVMQSSVSRLFLPIKVVECRKSDFISRKLLFYVSNFVLYSVSFTALKILDKLQT